LTYGQGDMPLENLRNQLRTLDSAKLDEYGDRIKEAVEEQQRKLEGAVEILVEIQKEQARRASNVAIIQRLPIYKRLE
jgi:ribosomal protein S10